MNVVYVYLAVYIAALMLLSFFISRRQSAEDFLISGRDRSGAQIMLSKFASAIGAGYFITYTGFAYEYGFGVYFLLVGICFGYLTFAYWASPKIYHDSKQKRFYIMGDYVFDRTKSARAASVTNTVSNIILILWLLVGVIGGAKIISDFGLMSYTLAVIFTTVVILTYLLLAGFKAVILTDVVQSIIIVCLLVLITLGIVGSESYGVLFSLDNYHMDVGVAVGFFLFGLLGIFSYSNMFQLCYAAKSKRQLAHGMGFSFVFIFVAAFLLLLIGNFMAFHVPGLDSGLVFTEALKNFLPASLLPFAIVLFFAGIMSSADTGVYAVASHYALPRHGHSIRHVRLASFVIVVLMTLFALIFRDIVDVSILAGGFTLTLSFSVLYLLFGGRRAHKFLASFYLSAGLLLVGVIVYGLEPFVAVFPIVGGLLGLLWWK